MYLKEEDFLYLLEFSGRARNFFFFFLLDCVFVHQKTVHFSYDCYIIYILYEKGFFCSLGI